MVSPRAEQLKSSVGYQDWPKYDVASDRVLVWNFELDALDGWQRQAHRRNCLPNGICVSRSTWERSGHMMVVESYECRNRATSQETVLEFLTQFHVPRSFVRQDTPSGLILADGDETNALVSVGNIMFRFSVESAGGAPTAALSTETVAKIVERPTVDVGPSPQTEPLAQLRMAMTESERPLEPLIGQLVDRESDDELRRQVRVFATNGEVKVRDQALHFAADHQGAGAVDCYSIDSSGTSCRTVDIQVDE